jgi:hypothetical protein
MNVTVWCLANRKFRALLHIPEPEFAFIGDDSRLRSIGIQMD